MLAPGDERSETTNTAVGEMFFRYKKNHGVNQPGLFCFGWVELRGKLKFNS